MTNFLHFHLVIADFQLIFICSPFGHLQYQLQTEEVLFMYWKLKISETGVLAISSMSLIIGKRFLSVLAIPSVSAIRKARVGNNAQGTLKDNLRTCKNFLSCTPSYLKSRLLRQAGAQVT